MAHCPVTLRSTGSVLELRRVPMRPWAMGQEIHSLLRYISTSYLQQLFLQAAFFQWKLCPKLCQQDFWFDYSSPGSRQAMPCHSWKAWAATVASEAWGTKPFVSCSPIFLVLQLKQQRPSEGQQLVQSHTTRERDSPPPAWPNPKTSHHQPEQLPGGQSGVGEKQTMGGGVNFIRQRRGAVGSHGRGPDGDSSGTTQHGPHAYKQYRDTARWARVAHLLLPHRLQLPTLASVA